MNALFIPPMTSAKNRQPTRKQHDHLTKKLDLPCFVCGVKFSTLKDKTQSRYGAKAMETHHHVIEWALANAIDPAKFNRSILPHLKLRHKSNSAYEKEAFTAQEMRDWVDHSEDNLWVLCDVHHRAKFLGIHEITYPIWCPMDLLLDDFEEYVKEQIQKYQPAKNKVGKAKAKRSHGRK
jgi:hypothetical protein